MDESEKKLLNIRDAVERGIS